MSTHTTTVTVEGPWSLATSRRFWEGFSPNALAHQDRDGVLHAVFRVEHDWTRAEVDVEQRGSDALITLDGDGDLDAAATQVARFLALDVDGRGWPGVAERDAVIVDAPAERVGCVWKAIRSWRCPTRCSTTRDAPSASSLATES